MAPPAPATIFFLLMNCQFILEDKTDCIIFSRKKTYQELTQMRQQYYKTTYGKHLGYCVDADEGDI